MAAPALKLLTGTLLLLCALAVATSGAASPLCAPGVKLPGCQAPPSSGPTGPDGAPQPPPQAPAAPGSPCRVKRSSGSNTFAGVVAEQIYGTESNYRGCALSALAETGVRIIRQPLRWSEIERTRGDFDFSHWDRYLAAVAKRRIQVLPILFEPPVFRSMKSSTRGVHPPRRNGEMAAFAARVARRYGTRGTFWKANPKLPKVPIRSWQIWNEPNLVFYWPPEPDAAEYVKLLAAVGGAIKRVDPKAEIVTAGFPESKLRGAVPQRSFLRALYAAGAKAHFDTLAIHSYTESHRELVNQVKAIRAEMRRHRDRARIWITEIGWATGGPDKKYTPGPAGQARRIDQTFRMARRSRESLGIRGVVYFMWQDAPPYPGFRDFWGLHTGLLDIDGDAKPGMKPFRRHAQRLRRLR